VGKNPKERGEAGEIRDNREGKRRRTRPEEGKGEGGRGGGEGGGAGTENVAWSVRAPSKNRRTPYAGEDARRKKTG